MQGRKDKMSREEELLVLENSSYWTALDNGPKEPETVEEEHFVNVCKGLESPVSLEEETYLKFRAMLNGTINENVQTVGKQEETTGKTIKKLHYLFGKTAWLQNGEHKILRSFIGQYNIRRSLSVKQLNIIKKI